MDSPSSTDGSIAKERYVERKKMEMYYDELESLDEPSDIGNEELNTSTPVEKQDADQVDVTLNQQWHPNDEDSETVATPRRSIQRKSPSPLQPDHDGTVDATSSPRPSVHSHIERCRNVMSSTRRSSWLENEDHSPMAAKGEMRLEELSMLQPDEINNGTKTPTRSTEALAHKRSSRVTNSPTRNKGIYVNVTDDVDKNPILATSVRSVRMRDEQVEPEDVEHSLQVLGASRCWTDRLDENFQEALPLDDDYELMATQTPIRSLTSYLPTSHSSCRYDSLRASPTFQPKLQRRVDHAGSTPSRCTTITGTPNRYTREMFNAGDAIDLDTFNGARLQDMRKEEVNPMAYATLPKSLVSDDRMGDELTTLYKHFKNMCTFIRRASMRNDRPYFKVVQLMVQRMTRKSFTIEQLKKMAWLAPNLISFKWVQVSEIVRRRYATEYRDCTGDVVHDLQIRIHKLDGRVCSSTRDFENTCLAFKTILCAWVAREEAYYLREKGSTRGFHPDRSLPIPTVNLVNKHDEGPNLLMVMSPPTITPSCMSTRLPSRMTLDATRSTAMLSSSHGSACSINDDTIDAFKSPPKVRKTDVLHYRGALSPASEEQSRSNKRSRELVMPQMSTDLLDTPGMRRIRENARRLSQAATSAAYDKKHDIAYWKDVKWFLNTLVQLSLDDERPPFMRLEWLADFINKHSYRLVTCDKVTEWANTLAQIAPDTIDVGVSKFDDYSTILTLHPNAKFDTIINYLNGKIAMYS